MTILPTKTGHSISGESRPAGTVKTAERIDATCIFVTVIVSRIVALIPVWKYENITN